MYEILKQIVAPCGMIWVGLIILIWPVWRTGNRKLLAANVTIVVFYTMFGNFWVACQLTESHESEYADVNPWREGAYDVVCVLGGGTSVSPRGYTYLNRGGDRVMLGARLYFCGRTKQLIATGQSRVESSHDPAENCAQIWGELNIPANDILRVGGRDTVEELEEIQRVCTAHGWNRIGLVTSVAHMQRVMDYAEKLKLELHALPAGTPATSPKWDVREHVVPQARGFLLNQYAVYEILGELLQ